MEENKGVRAAAIVAAVVVLVIGFLLFRAGGSDPAAGAGAPYQGPGQFLVGIAKVPQIDLFATPDAPTPVVSMTNPTFDGYPLAFMIRESGPDGWLRVQYPARPNGSTAWMRTADIDIETVPNRVVIALAAKVLTVYRGTSDEKLFEAPVAIGAPGTPTPLGEFYVDATLSLSTDPTGPYGAYQIAVAGYSDVIMFFAGRPGQIGIHGTNQPEQIGQEISNGCIRLTNENVVQLALYAGVGTPVNVIA